MEVRRTLVLGGDAPIVRADRAEEATLRGLLGEISSSLICLGIEADHA